MSSDLELLSQSQPGQTAAPGGFLNSHVEEAGTESFLVDAGQKII